MASCSKFRLESLKEAEDYVRVVRGKNVGTKREKSNYRLHAYQCPECGYFHIGHRRGRGKS